MMTIRLLPVLRSRTVQLALFKLLGLQFAEDGPKCEPFSSTFKMLGVVMDLSESSACKVTIGHTKERSCELAETIAGHLKAGTISSKEAERLRGRMIFFRRVFVW